ncbi:MAG TPA: RNA-binding S4 domain-containing protein [Bacteroidales bacterium]|jgi:ribosome-associated heat shock protein Hsp15|nr:RNA-binding S4 domain-containing protein [Bacteroidales bacterium]
MPETIRIDKWLWAIRIYKTRSLASEACRAGKVKISGITVKPSREIKAGDIIVINLSPLTKTVEVLEPIKNRVGAKLVPQFANDLTPQEEYDKVKLINEMNFERRDRGSGRPTKKQRRLIDYLKDEI